MAGYNFPVRYSFEQEKIQLLVGCKRCGDIWYEAATVLKNSPRINSASMMYDYCDKCKKPEDETYVRTI